MQIDFLLIAEKFPYNKIYGTIEIEPESARQLIKNFIVRFFFFDFQNTKNIIIYVFKLIVDDCYRGEFESNYQNISISGFDIEKEKPVNVKIRAVPIHDNCNEIKESEDYVCYIQYRRKHIIHFFVFRNLHLIVNVLF